MTPAAIVAERKQETIHECIYIWYNTMRDYRFVGLFQRRDRRVIPHSLSFLPRHCLASQDVQRPKGHQSRIEFVSDSWLTRKLHVWFPPFITNWLCITITLFCNKILSVKTRMNFGKLIFRDILPRDRFRKRAELPLLFRIEVTLTFIRQHSGVAHFDASKRHVGALKIPLSLQHPIHRVKNRFPTHLTPSKRIPKPSSEIWHENTQSLRMVRDVHCIKFVNLSFYDARTGANILITFSVPIKFSSKPDCPLPPLKALLRWEI